MTAKEVQLMQQAYNEVVKYKDKVSSDPYRLDYHLMPPVGLLNDPNGLIQYKGVYHVFYQWNPFATTHGAKYWGHYSSTDMVHWRLEPIALAPREWYERNGCYSGSAVEENGLLYLFYTGNVKNEDGTRETYQCLAVSSDGIHFEKKGPVLRLPKGYNAHFRDPKVWRSNDRWYMVVGAQTHDEKGEAVLFTSTDLYNWEKVGRMAGSGLNGLGNFGYMWECPDLIHLNGKEVLLVSPQGLKPRGHLYHNLFQSGYFVGQLDYRNGKFRHGDFVELDRGFDFYAPQTFTDEKGRTVLYGWMGITDEDEQSQPTISNNWVHALTLPRKVELIGEKVYQRPLVELEKLRKNQVRHQNVKVEGKQVELAGVNGTPLELLLNSVRVGKGKFEVTLRNEAVLSYDADKQEMSLQRTNVKTKQPEIRTCKLSSLSNLQIFMDRSSIEVFINNGEEVYTARYFPAPDDLSISFKGNAIFDLTKWDLEKIKIAGGLS
ncbi:glycoside hydrolase family 32 protein [Neobacillus citreus]|uniref:Sucrose-6-phosphate hydrolase n=1 Tax=Neobacillus citreus TaxID=2833578 RepID=A0A942TAA2_9BACI|nr:sucrose-6-phosphate hydrolase [Neobacillus citreus]MCH6269120.1 sucrose-6-phosphate hydrolase [Neobacillus citreus]